MPETKSCKNCGRQFSKPTQYSYKQWEQKVYCTRKCQIGYLKSQRSDKAEETGFRVCPTCSENKPLADFYSRGQYDDGGKVYRHCRPCHNERERNSKLKRLFGIDSQEYEQITAYQGNVCFICHRVPPDRRLAVDHDHKSGLVRGALCGSCNRGIAWWRDDPERLQRASDYLLDPPAVRALGRRVYGVKGRTTKRRTKRRKKRAGE